MKKIILLFTLLCTGALIGMESAKQAPYTGTLWQSMPCNVREPIKTYLDEYNSLDDVINAIKSTKTTRDFMSTISGFTQVMHILAKQFNTTPLHVAEMFNTTDIADIADIAEKYIDRYNRLAQSVSQSELELAKKLIANKADAAADPSLIHLAIDQKPLATPMIRLLLVSGKADPLALSSKGERPLEHLNRLHKDNPDYESIKILLENLMKQRQQQ